MKHLRPRKIKNIFEWPLIKANLAYIKLCDIANLDLSTERICTSWLPSPGASFFYKKDLTYLYSRAILKLGHDCTVVWSLTRIRRPSWPIRYCLHSCRSWKRCVCLLLMSYPRKNRSMLASVGVLVVGLKRTKPVQCSAMSAY